MENSWYIVGVDPSPSKDTVLCHGKGFFDRLPPQSLRSWFYELLESYANVLIAWGSPLGFGSDNFYDRTIDQAVRSWVAARVEKGRIEEKAVTAGPFADLPGWALSCHALGHPFGTAPGNLRLVGRIHNGHCLVEVNPAVALAVWWLDKKVDRPLKPYHNSQAEAAMIARELGFPEAAGADDDHLDAYAAFKLGELFVQGEARWVGSAVFGGYVLPDCLESDAIESVLLAEKDKSL
ncbi:MAG: hypothetical protein AB1724_00150 [Thermodesulfobacteriota bacterium]